MNGIISFLRGVDSLVVAVGSQKVPLNRGNGSGNFFLATQGDRVPDWPETRSQGHRSISENPFVVGVWRFRATLYEGEGGALCGALLPITVFLAVKVTGEAGLALWESVGGFAPLSVVAPQVGFGAEA